MRLTERKSKCFKIAHFSRSESVHFMPFVSLDVFFQFCTCLMAPTLPFKKLRLKFSKFYLFLDPNPSAIQSFCCCCKQQENRDYFFYVVVKNMREN